jgi:hypothetical protein
VVQTSPPANAAATANTRIRDGELSLLASLFVFLLPRRLRRRGVWLLMALLVPVLAGTISACGSAGTLTGGTTPGTYTITVTGNAIDSPAPMVETATTTLRVNSLF